MPTPSLLRRFAHDRHGNVAILFGLAVLPLFGFVGATLDYGRATHLRADLQVLSDEAALAAAAYEDPVTGKDKKSNDKGKDKGKKQDGDLPAKLAGELKNKVMARHGSDVEDVQVEVKWINPSEVSATARAKIKTSILAAVPGMPTTLDVAVEAVARVASIKLTVAPPKMMMLDPEAGDYNEISMYCYDKNKKNDPDQGRKQMTVIADNGGTTYSNPLPQCFGDEVPSYRLRNVRGARSDRAKWDGKNPHHRQYDYFTDTEIDKEAEKKDPNVQYYVHKGVEHTPILETVMCDSIDVCKPQLQGGVIPVGKKRQPNVNKLPCGRGKFQYFGWEDRVEKDPILGDGAWTDLDFDDIRLVIECPIRNADEKKAIALVK